MLVEGHGIPIGLEGEGANRNDAQDAPGTTPEHSHCSARADRRATALSEQYPELTEPLDGTLAID